MCEEKRKIVTPPEYCGGSSEEEAELLEVRQEEAKHGIQREISAFLKSDLLRVFLVLPKYTLTRFSR